MSVLTCTVCQGAMKEVSRNGVLIDTCTQCRGVWLDRGELEKLASIVAEPGPKTFLGGAVPSRSHEHRRHDEDDDDDDRRRYGRSSDRRRSFLDFFD